MMLITLEVLTAHFLFLKTEWMFLAMTNFEIYTFLGT